MPGRLILCATPIGNLGDASARLAATIASVDLVYVEDTRRSRKLLSALGISKPLRSYFAGNEADKARELGEALRAGHTIALLTDAGTPAIADPGLSAIRAARAVQAEISVVPGPSALTAALAVSGFPSERFVFEGFLPRRGTERNERLAAIKNESRTSVIFVGSAHLLADLRDLAAVAPNRELCIARELTKVFEEIQWLSCEDAVATWQQRTIKGEFTLVLAGAKPREIDLSAGIDEVLRRTQNNQSMASAVRIVASEEGLPRRQLYEAVLARTRDTKNGR
ncbi:16S rRNA (cytidine(1402)-2'-O)-methyltransferase [soil metagenome]|nr:16S rRNA (cytidine(1402)-2'-O)-methyltransferase [Actinomycetota bacterium]